MPSRAQLASGRSAPLRFIHPARLPTARAPTTSARDGTALCSRPHCRSGAARPRGTWSHRGQHGSWALSVHATFVLPPPGSQFWVFFGIKVLFEVTRHRHAFLLGLSRVQEDWRPSEERPWDWLCALHLQPCPQLLQAAWWETGRSDRWHLLALGREMAEGGVWCQPETSLRVTGQDRAAGRA